ncbi:MAG: S-methyl-5-thioribose-1-phosphate isomerase [Candidatus Omnitrophica bacterium]|nr:S-methyl-5-thioribose-1-phosphate isomerase [Candidatus Omnitrophota bacterium]
MIFAPMRFRHNVLELLDQRKLPLQEKWLRCRNSKDVYWAIKNMVVRGAPAIGIVGGYGLYLGIARYRGSRKGFFGLLRKQAVYLKGARPTGVNLRNVIDEIVKGTGKSKDRNISILKRLVLRQAQAAHHLDEKLCRRMGAHGAKLLRSGDTVLTHCNAGGLATSGFGTALGVFYAAKGQGKKIAVFADETRPLLQGARLTAWELTKSKIPCTLICDNMAACMMKAGRIDAVIVGADRIAANGDTANKIGTYNLAVLARAHRIPFYIAAPVTTFDFSIRNGKGIPIEYRDPQEVTEGLGKRIAPRRVKVLNPAFDVTPHLLITSFITEAGVLKKPFRRSFLKLRKK